MERPFTDLNETEKVLRSLIFAIEDKDNINPHHPVPMGEEYLKMKLQQAKEYAKKIGIPLVKRDEKKRKLTPEESECIRKEFKSLINNQTSTFEVVDNIVKTFGDHNRKQIQNIVNYYHNKQIDFLTAYELLTKLD